jgi:hypothetical protein
MKKNEIKVGEVYSAKVSDRVVPVRIDSVNSHGGWNATNTATGRRIHIKSPQRLRRAVTPKAAKRDAPAGQTPGEQGIHAAKAEAQRENARLRSYNAGTTVPKRERETAAAKPDITPTVEIVTGQTLPADKAAAPKPKRAKKADGEAKPKKTSMLDAAAVILGKAKAPMHTKDIIEAMAAADLWTSPGGKTPHATLDAAMRREIKTKPDAARFAIAGRGLFQFNA